MSATLSEQVESLKQQTDLLRESAGKLVGQDLTNYNIGNIASAIEGVTPEPEEEEGYVRPSWYPNVEDILNNAPEIVKDGVTYTPCVGALYLANEVTTTFYKTANTSSSSAVNYFNGTGCEAYIFSDVVQNDISNANETTLEVGDTISHKWNELFNVVNPDPSDGTNDAVRWAIWYRATPITTYPRLLIFNNISILELFGYKSLFSSSSFEGYSSAIPKSPIRYLKLFSDFKFSGNLSSRSGGGFLEGYRFLEEIIIDCDISVSTYYSSQYGNQFYLLPCLKKIEFNGSFTGIPQKNFLSGNGRLASLKLPDGLTSLPDNFLSSCRLKEFIVPSTVKHFYGSGQFANSQIMTISFPSGIDNFPSSYSWNNVESIVMPNSVTESGVVYFYPATKIVVLSDGLHALSLTNSSGVTEYLKIPQSVERISDSGYVLSNIKFVELYNDFDISGIHFYNSSSSAINIVKPLQWLKDLCGWLKDRTGETANTMVLGTANLANANQIFLTFDPDNKRNITWVDEGTEGAISITDFITNQLNWTLS